MAYSEPLQVSIIGMPGSGKTVLVSTMAMRMAQNKHGVSMVPAGAERHRTHKYVTHNWLRLKNGQWPESTPTGEQVIMQWELKTKKNTAMIRFSDCAGQDIRTIFSDDNFNPDNLSENVKSVYDTLYQSDIVLVLINMEDLIGRNAAHAAANSADLDLMISILLEDTKTERKIALIINQYDRYKAEVNKVFHGNLNQYFHRHLPLLYARCKNHKELVVIPVAAVAETITIEQNGVFSLVPAPDFRSYNIMSLITWITESVDELALSKETAAKIKAREEQIKREQEKEAEFKSRVFLGSCVAILLVFLLCVFAFCDFTLACSVTFLLACMTCGYIGLFGTSHIIKAGITAEYETTRTPRDVMARDERVRVDSKAGDRTTRTVNGVEFAFRWCPAGTFMMGSPVSEWNNANMTRKTYDETQHEVTLGRGFWMLETQVTQQQWQAIMGFNPSWFKGDNLPVENVSWNDCQEFCKLFNSLSGLKISLPTEAQWEYACRAGTMTAYNFGSSLNGNKANCNGFFPFGTTTKGKSLKTTTPVGSYSANAWGLYDMHGNVLEWCSDRYGAYPNDSVTDPAGAGRGGFRVARGGNWFRGARLCRSAYRNYYTPNKQNKYLGFRPVLVPGSRK